MAREESHPRPDFHDIPVSKGSLGVAQEYRGGVTRIWTNICRFSITTLMLAGISLSLSPLGPNQLAAAATTIPLCRTSQLRISAGTVIRKTDESSVHLYFTNTGRTCDLDNTEPGVQAVNGKRHVPVGTGTTNDLMMRPVITLTKGQHSRSTLIVARLTASPATRCTPVTTNGILVGDGLPYSSTRYVPLVLHGVCSSPSVGNLAVSYYARASG
jgi:hypothetical protein